MISWTYTTTPELTEIEKKFLTDVDILIQERLDIEREYEIPEYRIAVMLAHLSDRLGAQSRRIQDKIQVCGVKTYF